jgi:predicted ribosome quality control (RQC) complex YloA/Tae2 family protein
MNKAYSARHWLFKYGMISKVINKEVISMALDGIVVRAITHELQACVGGRISKIHQPTEHEIVLQVRANGENKRLLLSANPTYPRVHWITQSQLNPTEAPMFCMLFRKHFEGAVIEAISQPELDRVLWIDVRHYDELGDISVKRIVVEIMGKHSNIILLDPATNTILDGIHHLTPSISSYRVIMPGSAYTTPPEQAKRNPLLMTKSDWASLRETFSLQDDGDSLASYLLKHISGISPQVARELAHRNQVDAFVEFSEDLRNHHYQPQIIQMNEGKVIFSAIPLTHIEGTIMSFNDMHSCLASYYQEKAERDLIKQKAMDLIRFLTNEKQKNVKKQTKLNESLTTSRGADEYRVKGELLTAYLHTIKQGDSVVALANFYDDEQAMMQISLDPQLSPAENAQAYFKKYTKSKNSIAFIEQQLIQTAQEIDYFERLLQQVESASLPDIAGIREELEEQGYVRRRNKPGKKPKKTDKPVLTQYVSSEGIPIYVGKNNLQNEYLTNRLANANDTWLHVKDMPGSHVVIRSNTFSDATLEEAALLAAHFSSGKQSSLVPVDYTLVRHVRKPSGAKPGYVIYEQQKTIFITPDVEKIALIKLFK